MLFTSAYKHFRTMCTNASKIIAVCQMTSTNNKAENLQSVTRLVKNAKDSNAAMAFFPEACDYVALNQAEYREKAESLDGPTVKSYRNLAEQHKIWLSIGGFHEINASTGSIHNTHIIINDKGIVCGVYHKMHLFDVEIPEQGINLKESSFISAGKNMVDPVKSPVGNIGLSICYDLRFPELSTLLRKAGAHILTYPSAFTSVTGEAHWETLLRSRAIENQCYVVAAAQFGVHNEKRTSHGRSLIVDPWGKIVAECKTYKKEEKSDESLALATVDFEMLDKIRSEMPILDHRRDDIYTLKLNAMEEESGCKNEDFKFCHKNIPASTVFFKTKFSYAFTNIRCVVPGHVLVSTRRVVKRLPDLTPEETSDLFNTVVKVQKVMERKHGVNSSTICVQDGVDAGQTVAHVHVHILPRTANDFNRNDEIYDALAKHDRDENPSPLRTNEEMTKEANEIKSYFNKS